MPWIGGHSVSAIEFADIDSDGDYDVFVGGGADDIEFYENIGLTNNPEFKFVTSSFDSIVISGSYIKPLFVDLDSDSDLDLYVLSTSAPKFFINTGTPEVPNYSQWGNYLFSISNLTGLDFGDIDSDGDYDAIGCYLNGKVFIYTNYGTPQSWVFADSIPLFNFGNSYDWIKPSLCDIDNDNDLDLFLGMDNGDLYFYRNDGDSVNYNFVYMTNNFANASVFSQCAPTFSDIDADEDYDLFCGEEYGKILYFENIGNPSHYNFIQITQNYLCYDHGSYAGLNLLDIDADGDDDLITGISFPDINYLENVGTNNSPSFEMNYPQGFLAIYGNCFGDVDADGDYDAIVCYSSTGYFLRLYENIGTPQEPRLSQSILNLIGNHPYELSPCLVDIDADEDLDLMVGSAQDYTEGLIMFYRNEGTPQHAVFELTSAIYQNIIIDGAILKPTFFDFDLDSDYDLLLTNYFWETIYYYENMGTPVSANYVFRDDHFGDITTHRPRISISDIDNDGDFDIFAGVWEGGIKFYRNMGYLTPNITISISGSNIILNWPDVAGAVNYKIFYSNTPYFTPTGNPQVNVFAPNTSWTVVNGVNQGKMYFRMVVEFYSEQ